MNSSLQQLKEKVKETKKLNGEIAALGTE